MRVAGGRCVFAGIMMAGTVFKVSGLRVWGPCWLETCATGSGRMGHRKRGNQQREHGEKPPRKGGRPNSLSAACACHTKA